MRSFNFAVSGMVLGVLVLAGAWTTGRAHACGGLFCNASQPVNQAAERIVFVENGDGTITAVIEIQYEGPPESFSWVLPVPGEPEIDVSSTTALDRLQAATNPQYRLQTRFEDGCPVPRGPAFQADNDGAPQDAGAANPGVVVVASGTVGPYDYHVIQPRADLPEPADAAIEWLENEGYDVGALGPEVLGPYLADGLNLLAFRLTKSSNSGSIRPIRITYASDRPFIPIRPTAVAANDDMGVMVWVVGRARAVPSNYKALELNEALIDWFNPMSTYNAVVSAAADESGGQGFVTELAADSDTLEQIVIGTEEMQAWTRIAGQSYDDPADFVLDAASVFSRWDGFEDALRQALTLPNEISLADFLNCPRCYASDARVTFDAEAFRLRLYEDVYRPMVDTQELLLSRPYVTRLYTTMSADEMTLDPAFAFNPDLDDVSNIHTAEQFLSCEGDGFRIVLSNGDTILGPEQGVWPVQLGGDQPAARKILQLSTRGPGEVLEDNSARIQALLAGNAPDGGVSRPDGGTLTGAGGDDDGCRVTGSPNRGHAQSAALVLLGLGLIAARRRTRPRRHENRR